jgi:SAM-dependent MidA family methyltransferase
VLEAKASSVAEQIAEEIRARGPIPFARFMELALYAPKIGYYERSLSQTGKCGDFYTSVSVGPLYGQMIGFDLATKLSALNFPAIQIIEAGAHDGQFASDILTYLRDYFPFVFGKLEYIIFEPSAFRQHLQGEKLRAFESSVSWIRRWSEIPNGIYGAIISNELLDAMAVHVFRWNREVKQWRELGVAVNAKEFIWTPLDSIPPEMSALLPEVPPSLAEVLPDEFAIEVSAAAIQWWKEAACAVRQGFLFTADYGLRAEQILAPERARGTLRTYSNHRYGSGVLQNPGDQDITAHVNFSAIISAGEAQGLKTFGLVSQGDYLKKIVEQIDRQPHQFPLWTAARFRQLTSLIHPEHLGRSFKILLQERG